MKKAKLKKRVHLKPQTKRRAPVIFRKANGRDTDVERQEVTKTIKVKLSVDEIAQRAKTAADKQTVVDELTNELNTHKQRLKPQIDEGKKEVRHLLSVIETGLEERVCKVDMVKDFRRGKVEYEYDGQVVESHDLQEDDRQQTLDLPESAVGTKATDADTQEVIEEETDANSKQDMLVI